MKKKSKIVFRRVDIQVSILTATIVLISSFCVFYSAYVITYNDMIQSLSERVTSIYDYVENSLDKDSFYNINTIDDFTSEAYIVAHNNLDTVRKATGVRYLYTAKQNSAGELIYVVDGLPLDAEDFRFPGDLIEVEIRADLTKALDGYDILPNEILKTEWGPIFITYLPVHDNGKVIGVVGIEFDASRQYQTYRNINIVTLILVIAFIAISVVIAVYIFRRISNPLYRDFSNTDASTGLKNRNSFLLDLQNINAKHSFAEYSVISIDLDRLKHVNDTLGHNIGDTYIKMVADQLMLFSDGDMVVYRIGGDEFAVLTKSNKQAIERYINLVKLAVADHTDKIGTETSVSAGYATFDTSCDVDLAATYTRADAAMYVDKRRKRNTTV